MHADPFFISTTKASKPLQLLHGDVHGLMKVPTHQGDLYWITFIDDISHFKAIYLLKWKYETFAAFKQVKAWTENVTGARLGTLRDHMGGWIHVWGVWGILNWHWHPETAHCQELPSAEWGCRAKQQDDRGRCGLHVWISDAYSLLRQGIGCFLSTTATDPSLQLCLIGLFIKFSLEASLICLCFMFGTALPMFLFRGTRDPLRVLDHTWRSVSSLDVVVMPSRYN